MSEKGRTSTLGGLFRSSKYTPLNSDGSLSEESDLPIVWRRGHSTYILIIVALMMTILGAAAGYFTAKLPQFRQAEIDLFGLS